jgi:hypothetical protein
MTPDPDQGPDVDYHRQVPNEGDLIPMAQLYEQLRVHAHQLRQQMFATLAHAGNGPGARHYSRAKLRENCDRLWGCYALVSELLRQRTPPSGGGAIPVEVRDEVHPILTEAMHVVDGRNPDGTERRRHQK